MSIHLRFIHRCHISANFDNATAASITEFKRDPMGPFHAGQGASVAILHRNKPAFYCVPPALYAQLMEMLDDRELARIADERMGEAVTDVNIDDL